MKRIKSFTALICILTILLSISACDLKSQITTPEETTTIPTTTTITETTEATTTTETTETETVATTTTETSEETSETTAKATTKPTSKKVNTTKKVVKKSPTKAPAKKPDKGYAIVKWKYIITSNDHDKDGNNIKRTFYGEFKCYTTEYGAKSSKKYRMCNTSEGKAFVKKCDSNYRNYTASPVKIVKFLN